MFTRLRLFVLTIVSLVCVYPFIGNATPLKITSKERVEYQNQIRHFLQETYYTTLCLAITEQDLHKDVVEDLMAEDTVRYQPIAKNDSMSMADAIELYGKGKYEKTVMIFTQFATDGDATAQYILGGCYKNGLGVSQDYNEAVKWFRKSAEQGYAFAQCDLGYCYDNGLGVSQDHNEAVKWYRKSAEQGDAFAQCNLGACYYKGLGVSQDYNEAVKWYRKSAEQGNAPAQNNLGDCYEYGRGVPIDIEEAKKWHQRFLSNKNRNE